MTLQDKIISRQNDEDMLKCQYASRYFFNIAENYSTVAFVFSFLSVLCIFIPESPKWLALLLPILLDALVFTLYFIMGKTVTKAALLRNHFDDTVLGYNKQRLPDNEMREIQTLIFKAISINEAESQRQMANTGRDNPPGVKNWYEFSKKYTDSDVVFECQTQNQWWNKEMLRRRLITYSFILLICIIGAILTHRYYQVSLLELSFCFGGIIITFADRIYENVKYCRMSIKIDDFCELLSTSKSKMQIIALQELIESRRRLRVVEINRIHKRNSKKFSEQYEQISKES